MTQAYDPSNVFAKILRGELPCEKVYEDDVALALMDIMPRGDGHVLVIPKVPARGLLDANLDHPVVLGIRQGGVFTRGSARDQRGRSVGNLPVNQASEGLLVKHSIAKRGHKGRNRTGKHGHLPCFCPILQLATRNGSRKVTGV